MEADVFSCGVILYALLSGGRYALTAKASVRCPSMYLQPQSCPQKTILITSAQLTSTGSPDRSSQHRPCCARFPFKRAGEDDTMSTGLRVNLEKWRAVAGKIAPLPQVRSPTRVDPVWLPHVMTSRL